MDRLHRHCLIMHQSRFGALLRDHSGTLATSGCEGSEGEGRNSCDQARTSQPRPFTRSSSSVDAVQRWQSDTRQEGRSSRIRGFSLKSPLTLRVDRPLTSRAPPAASPIT